MIPENSDATAKLSKNVKMLYSDCINPDAPTVPKTKAIQKRKVTRRLQNTSFFIIRYSSTHMGTASGGDEGFTFTVKNEGCLACKQSPHDNKSLRPTPSGRTILHWKDEQSEQTNC